MSRMRHILEISAPYHNGKDETIVSTGHRCEYCQGNGYFWKEREGDPDPVQDPCPVCQGKGKLDCIINIKWKPSGRE